METAKLALPFLSCEGSISESFLSCVLRCRNQILNSQKSNLKASSVFSLSCQNSKSSESKTVSATSYRADIEASRLMLGIDPGITGALAFISIEKSPKFIAVYDFPTKKVMIGKKLKSRIDLEALSFLIESYSKDINLACLEEVGQIGTDADPFSSFVFGFSTGSVHGILAANDIKTQTVKPLIWKGALGLDADKSKAINKAKHIFPEAEKFLKRKKDHGRAEAILIAYFAWKLGGGK